MKRQRGRGRKPGGGGGGGGGNPGNRPMESNGPDNVKIRGNAAQIYEKYMQYSRDAQSSGDRVKNENLLQHAEHYFRIMAATMPREQRLQQQEIAQFGSQDERDDEITAEAGKADEAGADAGSDDGADEGEAETEAVEARGDDAQSEDDGEEQAEASDDSRGNRGRRRGRRKRPDGERGQGEGRGERAERSDPPADREARSALDALAHRQAAVAGN